MRYWAFAIDCLAVSFIAAFLIVMVILTDLYPTSALLALREYGALAITILIGFLASGFWMLLRWLNAISYSTRKLTGMVQSLGIGGVGFTGIFTHSLDHGWHHDITVILALLSIVTILAMCIAYLTHTSAVFRERQT